jgi:hypothetical protein
MGSPQYSRQWTMLKVLMRRVSLVGTVLLLCVRIPAEGAQKPAIFAQIEASMAELSEVTGLAAKHKVRADTINKEQLKKYLEDQIKRELKPQGIRAEEMSLKKLGLVPDSFDLARSTVDLMTEQAAAFYDYRKKTLFLLEGSDKESPEEQQTVLTHELAHALADQHFNLNKYLHRSKNDDSSIARMAVMEGQATWLMYELQAKKAGKTLADSPALVDSMSETPANKQEQYPVLSSTPLYMRASLLFPYMQGLRFQEAVERKLGKEGFKEVYRRPPANSQEILHPEKYLANASVSNGVLLPTVVSTMKFHDVNAGTIGEFDHAVLLEQFCSKAQAQALAPHWDGGAFRLLESKDAADKRTVLLYASKWDDPANARKMFSSYRNILAGKWKTMHVVQDTPNVLAGEGDDGYFCTRLDGIRVSSIEGMKTLEEALASSEATSERLR